MLFEGVIKRFVEKMDSRGRSQETLRGYLSDLSHFNIYLEERLNGPVYVSEITTDLIEEYIEKRRMEVAPTSVNRTINVIRNCMGYCLKQNLVKTNVAEDIELVKVKQVERIHLSEEELNILLEALDPPVVKEACRLMAYTGARVSECTNLTLEDVDFDKDVIRIINGKGGKDRTIPMNMKLKEYLLTYRKSIRPKYVQSNRFFCTKKTGEVSQQYLNRKLRETTKKLGWDKRVTCHILRHTFASRLVSKNVNIVKISKMLGHADVRTTSIYTHSSLDELAEAINLLA